MNSQFRQFVESSPDAIIIVNSEGLIRHANAHAASLFGYDRARLLDRRVQNLFPHQPALLLPGDRFGPQEHAGRRVELLGSRCDSSRFPAEVQIVPLQTGRGPEAVMIIRDISEARRAQLVLDQTLEVLQSADRDRQLLLGLLVHAQEEERKRIAAGVHDDTIQVITAVHLRVQQLRHRLRDPAEVGVLDKLEEALKGSLDRLRRLVFDLRPASLEDGHLAAALRVYLEEMRSSSGIAYQLEEHLTTEVPSITSVLIYRTATEALTNVRKHAGATRVWVTLSDLGNGCLVRIVDDGVGYNPADVENNPGHLGLALLRERPRIAGGWCKIESAPAAGTTVEFWMPTAEPPPARDESAA